jgi:hypothetical protein
MTEATFEERRRVPRQAIGGAVAALLPITVHVRVREISVIGLLVESIGPVELGSQGCLRMMLSGMPFTADIEVRRVTPSRAGHRVGYDIAASFVAISPEHRELIERFVKQ